MSHNVLKHTINDLNISDDNPFCEDTLDRSRFANLLTAIISNYSDGFVLSLNGKWGTGKTVFINQWVRQLVNSGFQATILNAWDNDYFGNPSIAILSQFADFFSNRTLSDKIKPVWTNLLNSAFCLGKGFIEKQVENFISAQSINELKAKYNGALESDLYLHEGEIKNYVLTKIQFSNYKNALTQFAADMAQENEGKPLIFVIDELDRCTPTYAVELLEKVKHLFNVPNIIFIFTIDKSQLKKSIKGYFGSFDFNADEYLRRFFDVEIDLPQIEYFQFSQLMFDYFEIEKFIWTKDGRLDFKDAINELATNSNLTLRQIEKFYAQAKLIFSFYRVDRLEWLIGVMLFLQMFSHEKFIELKDKKFTLNETADILKNLFKNSQFEGKLNLLGKFLYHINCYLHSEKRFNIDNVNFDNTKNFSEEEKTSLLNSFKYESNQNLQYDSIKKIIQKLTFIEQFISKNY